MPSSYTNVLRFEKPGQGDYLNNWAPVLGQILDKVEATITGITEIVTAGGTITLSTANGAIDEASRAILWVTGALTASVVILVPNAAKHFVVLNETTGGFTVGVRAQGGSNTVTIPQNRMGHIFATGDGRVLFVAPIADADGKIDTSALPVATQTVAGIVRLATDPEVATGTATDIAPSVKQVIDRITAALASATIADGNKGDVTVSGSGAVWGVNAGAVTGPKLGALNDLSATQLQNLATTLGATPAAIAAILAALSVFGSSGAGHAKGLVPDPGAVAGTTRFLREDGGWALASVTVTEAAVPPASPNPGDLWWDTASETVNVYVAAVGWIDISTIGTPGSTYTEGAAPPASPNFGDRWWDTLTLTINVYTSSGWIQH